MTGAINDVLQTLRDHETGLRRLGTGTQLPFAVIAVALFAASFASCSLSAQPIINVEQWGPTSDGLRMAISAVASDATAPRDAEFYVALQNVGSKDTVLNLGDLFANGIVAEPYGIELTLTEPSGSVRELRYSRRFVLAGRLDDFVVPLPTGATYVLRLNLAEGYLDGVKLSAGRYRIAAHFECHGAYFRNPDLLAISFLNFCKGSVHSNSLEFEIPVIGTPKLP